MAKLMKAGKVHEDWEPYVSKADTYLKDFDYQGDIFTCESTHFASPEDDPPQPSEDDDTGETTEPVEPNASEEPKEPEEADDSEEPEEPEGPKTLKFSSEHNTKSFGDSEPVVDEDTGGIVMGLDQETAKGWIGLNEALEMFKIKGPNAPKKNPLEKLFAILRMLGVLEIDVERDGNGFWVLPKIEKKKVEETNVAGEGSGGDPTPADGDGDGETPKSNDVAGDKKAAKKNDTTAGKTTDRPDDSKGTVKPPVGTNVDKPDAKTEAGEEVDGEADEEAEEVEVKSLEVATRLAYKLRTKESPDAEEFYHDLQKAFPEFKIPQVKNLLPDDLSVTLTDIISFKEDASEPDISSTITIQFLKTHNLVFYISQTDGETTLALRQESKTVAGKDIPPPDPKGPSVAEAQVTNLKGAIDAPSPTEAVPGDNFKSIRLWYADVNTRTKKWVISLIMVLEISGNDHGKVPIYLQYDKGKNRFSGGMLRGELPEETNLNLPTYREYHVLPKDIMDDNDKTPWIDLALAYDFKAPEGLPTKLTKAKISYTNKTAEEESSITFAVALGSGKPAEASDLRPPTPFTWDKVGFEFEKTRAEDGKWTFTSEFLLKEQLPAGSTSEPREGKLGLEITKQDKGARIIGTAEKINFAMLASFFEPNMSEAIVSVLGKLEIAELVLDYNYTSKGKASDFLFTGIITIGKLRLDLFYQFASKLPETTAAETEEAIMMATRRGDRLTERRRVIPAEEAVEARGSQPGRAAVRGRKGPVPPPAVVVEKDTAWQFEAYLSASGPGETLGTIIESIVGQNPLPSFISNINVPTVDVDVESGKPLISLKVAKEDDKIIFIFDVNIDIVSFSFVQIGTKKDPNSLIIIPPVRILRLSIGPLPFIEDIPIVKELPQPYQLLTFCYVGGGPINSLGVSINDLKIINDKYLKDSKIFHKAVTKNQTIALRKGNHFIIINNDECILDHVFSTGPAKEQPAIRAAGTAGTSNSTPAPAKRAPLNDDSKALEPTNPPAKGALEKKSKLLTINGISVQYKNNTLWLFINATLAMGPVELSLIGFGIGLKLGGSKLQLNNIIGTFNFEDDLDFQINGIAMNFDRPPVLIAGVFIHEVTELIDSYRGGIAVGVKPYEFVAVGEYAEVLDPLTAAKYKSIFLYAKLDGPLIDLQIAIIKGVRLGFGYNSFVRMPSVNELAEFPFINDSGISGAGNNPMKILDGMRGGANPWVAPKQDSFWFALGFSVSAFNLLTATAVALLGFSDEGVVVSIFADVVGKMPPEVDSPEMCILYVELLMNAELNFIHDYFFVQAALAPTSFLLVPQCHLYGGFAMGTWFGRSQYAGDWVFSVGGYHRNFQRPAHYPNPERLGIKFNIGDNITIRGEGYFAITPKCVMGGSMILINISVGPVSAHLSTAWDAVLQFKPLHYVVDAYVEVGVSCRIHLLFVSFDISVEIGADLHIEGPEFGGVAHVDFWFFGFDIYFGEQPHPPPALTLGQFYDVVAKAGPPEAGPPEETTTVKQDSISSNFTIQLKLSLEEGAAPAPVENTEKDSNPPNAGANSKWRVRGGNFKFRVSSVFAISEASIETGDSVAIEKSEPDREKSLELQVPRTEKAVEISSIPMKLGPGNFTSPLSIKITNKIAKADKLDGLYPAGWQPEFVVKLVPTALWGDPARPVDPMNANDGCVPLRMAVSVAAPLPILAISKIPAINATDIMKQGAGEKNLAKTEKQSGMVATALSNPPATWPEMQTIWEETVSDRLNLAKALVGACVQVLGWDAPAPEVLVKIADTDKTLEKEGKKKMEKKPWELDVKLPGRLVSGNTVKVEGVEDGLDNFYLALPRVCVA